MRFKDRLAARNRRFYAGKRTPDTLFVMHGAHFPDGSDDAIVCFSSKRSPERCRVGKFCGSRIVPLSPEETEAALDFAASLKKRGRLRAEKITPVKAPLVTALSSEEYFAYRDRLDLRRRTAIRRTVSRLRGFPPEYRLGFALLVIGLASYLTLSYSRSTVWSEFYLLNGTYVSERQAAWIYFAWSVPLTLFNAFFVDRYHGFSSILLLGFAPVAIRYLSLLRNYSVVLMLIVAGILLAAVILTFILRLRYDSDLFSAIELTKLVGSALLMLVFTVFLFADLLLPNRTELQIRPPVAQSEGAAETESRFMSTEELKLLNSPEWDSLSAEKRCALLLSVVREVSPELGVETPALYLDVQMPGNEAGYYDQTDNSIHLWRSYIEQNSAAQTVNVVLHELYHAYEYAVVSSTAINWDSPDIDKYPYFFAASEWKKDFERYVSGDRWDVSTSDYWEQAVESDARAFAAYYQERFVCTE